ncbi:MAG: HEAT repeat-containing protein [Candidatus Kentron sp. G]|nr:MAG: HEAT repeat-containing protein [Candidatus Kentron sp. G]
MIARVRLSAAVSLLAWNNEAGLPLIEEQAQSQRFADRKELAELLGRVPSPTGIRLLRQLVADPFFSVKEAAIHALGRSAGHHESVGVLADLDELLDRPNARLQTAAANAIGAFFDTAHRNRYWPSGACKSNPCKETSPEEIAARAVSIEHLARAAREVERPLLSRFAALEALEAIAAPNQTTNQVAAAVFEIARADREYSGKEPYLGIRTLNLLGKLGAGDAKPQVLDWMDDWLHEIEQDYARWRKVRDSELPKGSDAENSGKGTPAPKAGPGPEGFYWAFELAFNRARIDPAGRGLDMLRSPLADVHWGAWMGIGMEGSTELLQRVFDAWRESKEPLFRQAAYKAMNEILVHLELVGGPKERQALQAFVPAMGQIPIAGRVGVCTRVDWTLSKLAQRDGYEYEGIPAGVCRPLL